ncbi:SGNH/GDSL hydrolase family protein [Ideonella sp. DXS22W]|uniref:SGNH/GDSL hydrolase family protein n=1 Tax=Pseudaquabacterium inlustre TaxID=2984192 RepID=A0ABU9CKG4_9BURK
MPLSTLFRPVLAAAVIASAAMPASAFDQVVVFGDSLSDTGRLAALSSTLNLPGIGTVPASPYVDGRFSNGMVAVEYLAQSLGLSGALTNYAYGGATSGLLNAHFGIDELIDPGLTAAALPLRNTGIQSQVGMFQADLAAAGKSASSSALYVVWGGANDFLYAPAEVYQSQAAAISFIQGVVGNLVSSVQTLYAMGARNFLLPTLPDLGITPRTMDLGAIESGGATSLSWVFNTVLVNTYKGLASALPDERFYAFNTFLASRDARASFANTSEACIATGDAKDCLGYMFFDDIHPTTATHAMLGAQMAAAVPEPHGVLLMALGALVLLGHSARRQRRA